MALSNVAARQEQRLARKPSDWVTRSSTSSRIYVFMAALFVLTAIASFAPTSLGLISRVYSGQESVPPPVVHFHAASMSLWLLLLSTQTLLANTRRLNVHRKLGLVSLVLAPCCLISMIGMDLYGIETFNVRDTVVTSAVLEPERLAQLKRYTASFLLIHGASYLLFPAFYLWALFARRRDSETHKRLMILATWVLLIPGLGRLLSITKVVPDLGLSLVDARHFYLLLLIIPALVYEIAKRGIPHRAYLVGVSLVVAWVVTAHFLSSSSWWIGHAPRLLGVG